MPPILSRIIISLPAGDPRTPFLACAVLPRLAVAAAARSNEVV